MIKLSRIKKTLQLIAVLFSLTFGLSIGFSAQAASVVVASGTVTLPDNTPVSGMTVELQQGDGTLLVSVDTDGSGDYSLAMESGDIPAVVKVELVDTPDGYGLPDNYESIIDYAGSSTNIDFEYALLTKTISVTVLDSDGEERGAQVSIYPLASARADSAISENIDGSEDYEFTTGGKYVVRADCNLSEHNPAVCPFIAIESSQIIEFTEADSVVEEKSVTINLTTASKLATLTLQDANGNPLADDGFYADITFTGYTKDYGVVSTRRKVNEDGEVSVFLLPGIWTISPGIKEVGDFADTQSFDPADLKFVISEDETTLDWGTIQASNNVGSISGTLVPSSGELSGELNFVATNLDNMIQYQVSSQGDGSFEFDPVSYGRYSFKVNDDSYITGQADVVELTADQPSATDVNVNVFEVDVTISGEITESDETITDLPAVVVAEAADGTKFSGPVFQQNGAYSIGVASALVTGDSLDLRLVPLGGADVFQESVTEISLVADQDVTADIETSDNEATVTGSIVTTSGEDVTSAEFGDKAKITALNIETGAFEEADIDSNGDYSLDLAPGDWTIIPRIPDIDATVLASNMSDTSVTVEAGATETEVNVSVQVADATVSGSIINNSGGAIDQAPILITNKLALQEAAGTEDIDNNEIVEIITTTDSDGSYSEALPAGEYTAYFLSNPEMDSLVAPDSQSFTVSQGETNTVDASYKSADAQLSGEITGGVQALTVTAYEENGAVKELSVNQATGAYEGTVTEGNWEVIAAGIKDNELWTGSDTVAVSDVAEVTANVAMAGTAVEVPAMVSVSGSVSTPLSLSNTAGAQVTIQPYAAGVSGQVNVELAAVPTIRQDNDSTQVGLSYEVNIVDSNTGAEITNLDRPVAVSMPVSEELSGDYEADQMSGAYYNESVGSTLSDGMVTQNDGSNTIMYTNHLTRFSALATGDVVTLTKPLKPKKINIKKRWKNKIRYSVILKNSSDRPTKIWHQFRWKKNGTTGKWSNWKKTGKKNISSSSSKTKWTFTQKKLKSGTKYQVRAWFSNGAGKSKKKVQAFRTKGKYIK